MGTLLPLIPVLVRLHQLALLAKASWCKWLSVTMETEQ